MSKDGLSHEPARIRIRRVVGWADTDASGHYQFQTVFRWLMEAESELHSGLGIVKDTHGSSPRLHVEADYLDRLWFQDRIAFDLVVERVGRTSLTYAFQAIKGTQPAVRGKLVVGYLPHDADAAAPWPDAIRQKLSQGGAVESAT